MMGPCTNTPNASPNPIKTMSKTKWLSTRSDLNCHSKIDSRLRCSQCAESNTVEMCMHSTGKYMDTWDS